MSTSTPDPSPVPPPIDPDSWQVRGRSGTTAAQRILLAGVAVVLIAALVVWLVTRPGGDQGRRADRSSRAQVLPAASGVGCPSSTPYPGERRQHPASAVMFYWQGRLYLEASDGATTSSTEPGQKLFTITCTVNDPPDLQDWVTPWPAGAAAGLELNSAVHRAAASTGDCIPIARTVWGDWRSFAAEPAAPGC